MEFIKTGVFLCCGVAAGYAVPNLAEKMIQYKCAKRNQNPPSFYMLKWYKQILMILGVSLFVLAAWKMPFAEAVIVCIFVMIALTATVIDIQIRIIANEMVLFLLVLGIIYRIVAGGIHSLLGSIGALAFIIAIFGGAAFITKVITNNTGLADHFLKWVMKKYLFTSQNSLLQIYIDTVLLPYRLPRQKMLRPESENSGKQEKLLSKSKGGKNKA